MVFFGVGYNTSLLYGAAYSKYNAVMLYSSAVYHRTVSLCIAPKERKPKNCSPIRKKKRKKKN